MRNFKRYVIAIDGPSGSGKTTLAKALAAKIGFEFLLTGKIYRAYAKRIIEHGVDTQDTGSILLAIHDFKLSELEQDLSSEAIANIASIISSNPQLREYANQYQKDFINKYKYVILEGRDIGTVICPDAELKIFLTAETIVRAQRRFNELHSNQVNLDNVIKSIRARDSRDSKRELAPLKTAADAIVIDNSNSSVEELVDRVLNLLPKEIYSKAADFL
jgi:cytidylate kinase